MTDDLTERQPHEMLASMVADWALPFHYHRDLMNAHLHGTIHVKWSEVTRQLALGLAVLDIYTYESGKVMYGWDEHDPDLEDDERAAIQRWRGIR